MVPVPLNPPNPAISPEPPGTSLSPYSPLLKIQDLRVYFHLRDGVARAVDGVSYSLDRGRTLGVVGESGCGKSVAALAILGLVPSPQGRIESGRILFKGTNLLDLDETALLEYRGRQIGMIFQEPMTALNPLYPVGDQVAEVFRLHQKISRREAWIEAVGILEKVQIPAPAQRARDYPHQLSGGMRQRVLIAQALACNPDLILADEPTTALDVTVQAQILALMRDLQESTGTALELITHDLGVVAQVAHDVVVLYAGQVVESAPVEKLFDHPLHPYTQGLLRSIPRMGGQGHKERLSPIEGQVPSPFDWPAGCRFHPRCPHTRERCRCETPELNTLEPGHGVRCHLVSEWI
jgi:peptide/nickel transport system ATP-binding protein/oligopeptide transport system ATP-binding protein